MAAELVRVTCVEVNEKRTLPCQNCAADSLHLSECPKRDHLEVWCGKSEKERDGRMKGKWEGHGLVRKGEESTSCYCNGEHQKGVNKKRVDILDSLPTYKLLEHLKLLFVLHFVQNVPSCLVH
jgi:hypothetical protein